MNETETLEPVIDAQELIRAMDAALIAFGQKVEDKTELTMADIMDAMRSVVQDCTDGAQRAMLEQRIVNKEEERWRQGRAPRERAPSAKAADPRSADDLPDGVSRPFFFSF